MEEKYKVRRGMRAGEQRLGFAVISAENHDDEPEEAQREGLIGEHRHGLLVCKPKTRFTTEDCRFWDLHYEGRTYHAEYTPMGKEKEDKFNVANYVIKKGNYIQWGKFKGADFDVNAYILAHKTHQAYGFVKASRDMADRGATIDDLMHKSPEFVMQHKRKIDEFAQYLEERAVRQKQWPVFPGVQDVPRNVECWEDWQKVVDWINKEFLHYGQRVPRQKQLWLWSYAHHLGKSYFFTEMLSDYFPLGQWCSTEKKQHRSLKDAKYIVYDNYKGSMPCNEMGKFVQMYKGYPLDIKCEPQWICNKNLPVIVTAQGPPSEIYKNCEGEDVRALESRFIIVNVEFPYHISLREPVRAELPQAPPQQPAPVENNNQMEVNAPGRFEEEQQQQQVQEEMENRLNALIQAHPAPPPRPRVTSQDYEHILSDHIRDMEDSWDEHSEHSQMLRLRDGEEGDDDSEELSSMD